MLAGKVQEKLYCGLDIGSQKVKAGLLSIKPDGEKELLGIYEQKTYGFKDGSVVDLGEFSECIHACIQKLSQNVGIKVKEIQLGVDGNMVDFRLADTAIPLIDRGSKIISSRDVKKLNKHARLLGIKVEEELLHDLPQCYKVDDVNQAMNPLGLYGRKLGVSSLLVLTNVNRFRNIIKAVNQAGFEVTNFYFSSYASAGVSLTDIDRQEGCALIDVGSKITSLLIFHEGILKFADTIPIGGDHITQKIADGLQLPFDLAEEIKKSYATALITEDNAEEEILVKRDQGYMPVIRGDIARAITPIVDEFVESLTEAVRTSQYASLIHRGIVMTGGGAFLSGLMERIEQNLNLSVKLGSVNIPAKKGLTHAAVFTSVVGLAYHAYEKSIETKGDLNGHMKLSSRLLDRAKELYQEYF